MLPRSERNTDRLDARRRTELRPVSRIAIQDQTTREKTSQVLVDETIQIEQQKYQPVIPVQKVRGDVRPIRDNVERIITTIPVKTINPVKVVPRRTTISGALKERMGVANIRAKTRRGAIPGKVGRIEIPRPQLSAVGTSIKEKRVGNTPVRSLNFLDQFFNWLNALLS